MKKLIKQISYLVLGTLALISTFLGFSVVKAVAIGDSATATATVKGLNDTLSPNGGLVSTFYEYIGDFCSDMSAAHVISAIFLVLAILSLAAMLFIVIMSLVKRDVDMLDELHIKWVAVVSFTCMLIALLIAVIAPDLPAGTAIYEFKASIGVGSILFLIGTGLAAIFAFTHKFFLKED